MSRRVLWVVLLGLALPALSWAQGEPGMGGGFGGGMGGRGGWRGGRRMQGQQQQDTRPVWETIGLSKDQLDKVHQILDDEQKSSAHDRQDLQDARADLEKMMRDDQPDRSAIEKQIDSVARLQGELEKSRAWAMLDARALLTPQQRKKLDQVLAERRGGQRPGGGPPPGYGGGGEGDR